MEINENTALGQYTYYLLYNHARGHAESPLLLAEREGFEPSERYKRSLPFQGSAIDHSAISPNLALYLNYYCEYLIGIIAIPPLLSK